MLRESLKRKKVLIMGLGLLGGGVGAARFFATHGAKVTVTDLKTKEQLFPSIEKLKDLPINYVLGKHREEDFRKTDLVIRNPDVLLDSPYIAIARQYKVPIEMAESFFVKHSPCPVIGVTGTRGKTTTASLVASLLKDAGLTAVLAGNVPGVSTLDFLDKITPKTYVILELSSWQLQGFGESKISPHISVITNIYPEHLNHYKTLRDYIEDKKNIFRYQSKKDYLILNKNSDYTKEFKREANSQILLFESDLVPGTWQLKLKGEHNRENIAAAIAVSKILNLSQKSIKKSIENFTPLPYHLERIRLLNGVTFINDGVSTTPEATIAAIKSFNKPLLLILGGNDKLLDFSGLGRLIDKKARAVFLMKGTATPKIKKAISKKNLIKGSYDNFKDTIGACYQFAQSGDFILFSPAATSFNWFNNIYHRSQEFEKIVKNL